MNQDNNRGHSADDRSDDRYGTDDMENREERRTQYPRQRQQQADSSGWLSQRQPGSSPWQDRGSTQPGATPDWQTSGQQPGSSGARGASPVSERSGYGGYEGQSRRYGNDEDPERYGADREGYRGQSGGPQRHDERERWGQWHQEGAAGRGGEWSNQRGSQRDEWGQQREQNQGRSTWDQPSRPGGWERGRDATRESWNEPSRPAPDMRTHYRGGYGVSDYEAPSGQSRTGQRPAAADWLDERERRDPWGSGSGAGYRSGYGSGRSRGGAGGYDPDDAAYEQFTGATERSGLNRGYGGAGASAAARRVQHVGPKGYQRSDERIREDLCERLAMSSRVDVRNVEVTVTAGVVTLAGTVCDRQQKYRIEDMADEVFGVKDVHNQIRVAREAGMRGMEGGSPAGGASGAASGAASGSSFGGTLGGAGGASGTPRTSADSGIGSAGSSLTGKSDS